MYSAYKLNKQGDNIQFLKFLKTILKVSIQQKQRKGEEKEEKKTETGKFILFNIFQAYFWALG